MSDAPRILCPYCGEKQPAALQCRTCSGRFDLWSLLATRNEMGPWFVRDGERPHFVGFSLDALRKAIRAGEVSKDAVVRGPTTGQYWTLVRHVQGLAHLFGRCHACHSPVTPEDEACSACDASTAAGRDRNALGLPPVDAVVVPQGATADLRAFVADGTVQRGVLVVGAEFLRGSGGVPSGSEREASLADPREASRSASIDAPHRANGPAVEARQDDSVPAEARADACLAPRRLPIRPSSLPTSPPTPPASSETPSTAAGHSTGSAASVASGFANPDAAKLRPLGASRGTAVDTVAESALSNIDRGLAARARRLESTNRVLFAAALLGMLVSLAIGFAYFQLRQSFDREVDAARAAGAEIVREELKRRAPVVVPKQAELPPMPAEPSVTGSGDQQPQAAPAASVSQPAAPR